MNFQAINSDIDNSAFQSSKININNNIPSRNSPIISSNSSPINPATSTTNSIVSTATVTTTTNANGTTVSKLTNTNKSSNDFVRIIYGILQGEFYPDIISWSESGDSFVVLDTGKFTTKILPNHFKHSNFASFVRQLNKYDFHKVKRSAEEKKKWKYGEQSWEFCHPLFKKDNDLGLNNIKRKITNSQKKNLIIDSSNNNSNLILNGDVTDLNTVLSNYTLKNNFEKSNKIIQTLQNELSITKNNSLETKVQLQKLNSKYNTLIESMMVFKNVHQNLLDDFNLLLTTVSNNGIKLPDRLQRNNESNTTNNNNGYPSSNINMNLSHDEFFQQMNPLLQNNVLFPNNTTNNNNTKNNSGLSPTNPIIAKPSIHDINSNMNNLNNNNDSDYILRKGFHVLLVEDDQICIKLCSKFLRKYGCTVRVVTDGLTAISVLENFRFDLVLMDIVMPNLDGATATSIVRNFDSYTPIIAMTGNIEDHDLITYLQHGMNDILAKPFTKIDLHSMLVRYLRDKIPLCEQSVNNNEQQTTNLQSNSNENTNNNIDSNANSNNSNVKKETSINSNEKINVNNNDISNTNNNSNSNNNNNNNNGIDDLLVEMPPQKKPRAS